jgi:hypothetical protein
MSTTLLNAEVALSKELGDYWAGTTTSTGSTVALVDTGLMAKTNDWVTNETFDHITSDVCIGEERKVSSLDSTTGTATTLAHTGSIAVGTTYRIHRLFSASDKRTALIQAAKRVYPHAYQEVWDETLVSGNWLDNGSFERWTDSTTPVGWTVSAVTATQTSTSPYYRHGKYSCRLNTLAGTVSKGITNFDDLKELRGRSVTFTIQGWCDTANCLRISINDGTTQTYSNYHAGDSAWTEDDPRKDNMYITQYIDPNATQVTFTIHQAVAAGTSYVDDGRVISDNRNRVYVGNLGLAQNQPTRVQIEPCYYSQREPWINLRGWTVDPDGYLHLPTHYPNDYRLRVLGKGYLGFLASGVTSTDWAATIELDEPQLQILIAEAALYLYQTMSLPNFETGTRKEYQAMIGYWKQESAERRARFGMYGRAGALAHWGS